MYSRDLGSSALTGVEVRVLSSPEFLLLCQRMAPAGSQGLFG
jgi:hypothetical protein